MYSVDLMRFRCCTRQCPKATDCWCANVVGQGLYIKVCTLCNDPLHQVCFIGVCVSGFTSPTLLNWFKLVYGHHAQHTVLINSLAQLSPMSSGRSITRSSVLVQPPASRVGRLRGFPGLVLALFCIVGVPVRRPWSCVVLSSWGILDEVSFQYAQYACRALDGSSLCNGFVFGHSW